MEKQPYQYAILGDGPGATAMLLQSMQLLKHAKKAGIPIDPAQIEITIIGRNKIPGLGFPFNPVTTSLQAMANSLPAISGITYVQDPDHPELKIGQDFFEWYKKNWTKLEEWFPGIAAAHPTLDFSPSPDRFYPRVVYGQYFSERFQGALGMAKELGVKVHVFSECEITDLEQRNNHGRERLKITYKDLKTGEARTCHVDHGTLATGHWQEQPPLEREARIVSSALPVKELNGRIAAVKAERPEAKIAIMGTSLSAHDTLFQLLDTYGSWKDDGNGKPVFRWKGKDRVSVTLISRNGLLPKVRGKRNPDPNLHFNDNNLNNCHTLAEMKALADKELAHQYQRPITAADWQEAMHPSAGARETLRRDIQMATEGDTPGGYVGWQTVFTKPGYDVPFNNLSPDEQGQWYDQWNTTFLMHAAPMTPYNAERLLHLMDAGIVSAEAVGKSAIQENTANKTVSVTNESGCVNVFDYMIRATGQTRDFSKAGDLGKNAILGNHLANAVSTAGGTAYEPGGIEMNTHTLSLCRPTREPSPYDVEPMETLDGYGAHTIGRGFWSSAVIDVAYAMKKLASEFVYRVADRQEVGSHVIETPDGPQYAILDHIPYGEKRLGLPDRTAPVDPFPRWTHSTGTWRTEDLWEAPRTTMNDARRARRRDVESAREQAAQELANAPRESTWTERAAGASLLEASTSVPTPKRP